MEKFSAENIPYFLIVLNMIVTVTMEELYFRLFIQEILLKHKYKISIIVFISSVSFGFIHFDSNIGRVIDAAIFGIMLSIVFIITKNLIYTIFLHFFGGIISMCTKEMYISFVDSIPNFLDERYLEFMNKYYIFCIIFYLIFLVVFFVMSYIKRKSILSEDIIKNVWSKNER